MPVLISWLGGAFASLIGYSFVRFTATKLVLWALMVTVLPVILTNFIYSLIEGSLELMQEAQSGHGLSSVSMQLTGLAAWVATRVYIPEGLSLVLSAVTFRIALRMIPFVRL